MSIQVDAVGLAVRLRLLDSDGQPHDLSAPQVASLQVILRSPGGKRVIGVASQVTDGKDGRIQYALQAGDVNLPGTWEVQGRVIFASGVDVKSKVGRIVVERNI